MIRKNNKGETALKQLDGLMRSELDIIENKISSEKDNLKTLKLQTIDAREKLKEFETILQDKREELSEQQRENARVLNKLNDEIAKTNQNAEELREKMISEVNEIIVRRNEIQDQVEKQHREFDIFKKSTFGEKERLQDEIARLSRFCDDERLLINQLKEKKANLERSIAEKETAFERDIEGLSKQQAEIEHQIQQLKHQFAKEWTFFNEKKKDLTEQENVLISRVKEKKEQLRQVEFDISQEHKRHDHSREKLALELEEVRQEIEIAKLQLGEVHVTIEDQRSQLQEVEKTYSERIIEINAQIDAEEQKLFDKRNTVVDEERNIEKQLKELHQRHKDQEDHYKTEIHQLEKERERLKQQTEQMRSKQREINDEIINTKQQRDAMLMEIDACKRTKDKDHISQSEELSQVQAEIARARELQQQEQQELQNIAMKRQKAESEYQMRIKKLRNEVDDMAQRRMNS